MTCIPCMARHEGMKIGAGHPYPEKKSTAPVAVTAVTKKIISKTLPLAEYLEAEEARYAGLLRSLELSPSTTGIMR